MFFLLHLIFSYFVHVPINISIEKEFLSPVSNYIARINAIDDGNYLGGSAIYTQLELVFPEKNNKYNIIYMQTSDSKCINPTWVSDKELVVSVCKAWIMRRNILPEINGVRIRFEFTPSDLTERRAYVENRKVPKDMWALYDIPAEE